MFVVTICVIWNCDFFAFSVSL